MKPKFTFILAIIFGLTACNIPSAYQSDEVKLYFSKASQESGQEYCSAVLETTRFIPKTENAETKAQLTFAELFKGPTTSEINNGAIAFWLDSAAMILDSKLEDGIFYINWVNISRVIPNASTSCGSQSFFAPIEKTLTQFPEVKSVRHAIKGNPQEFYDWMQIGCPAEESEIPGSYCDPKPFEDMASL